MTRLLVRPQKGEFIADAACRGARQQYRPTFCEMFSVVGNAGRCFPVRNHRKSKEEPQLNAGNTSHRSGVTCGVLEHAAGGCFLVAFVAAAGASTFYFGAFMERRQADLIPFFLLPPLADLILVPAVGMRLWAEERRQGTIELLMTLPVTSWQAVLGKFLAAWVFVVGIALGANVSDVDYGGPSR